MMKRNKKIIIGIVLFLIFSVLVNYKLNHNGIQAEDNENIVNRISEKKESSFSIIKSMDGCVAIGFENGDKVTIEELKDRHTVKCVVTPKEEYNIYCTVGNSEYFCGYIFTDENDTVIDRFYDPTASQLKHMELRVTAPRFAKYLYINTQGAVLPNISTEDDIKLEHEDEFDVPEDLDSEEYTELEDVGSHTVLEGKKIAILGDSISSVDYELPVWWQIIESSSNCQFLNYAISSTSISHVDKRHLITSKGEVDPTQIRYIPNDSSTWYSGNCFCERYTEIDKNVDCIVIFGGANDIGQPRGAWDSKDTDTFYGGLNELFSGIKKNHADIPVLVCSLIPRLNERDCDFQNPEEYLNSIRDVDSMSSQLRSAAIKLKADQYNFYYIDLYNNYGMTIENDILRDGLHPNKKGQELLARSIESRLIEIFSEREGEDNREK